ncbi:MAG: 2-isopropylmalate synthase [Ignavibacteria bacterium RIFOXYB2_FULL_35_12]|nr:MAG: 2-isopropylmalate synthase [Ignavibacteria bacterium GWA2_36_19]OGU55071.1 MAG: 2-isopropylmalate synthase [Ignavibacteria bacterium GWC2_35_8]OGU59568.1 MAG: 2-isopropylmalate synthase [Ignavibacteria bacterium GWF2_35_20]OGU78081.1 MAG: 2-isopropylmalate synthase [Ignavibacteria bacterium RIFOXYA2_FULL_35_9]OGU87221.1 MAG: 2-isopropylmalate synthase [Ignavibacteria bacterium RIFOXYA12_FULL_35_25]OGU90378.1 MAG: 2-isopropylmalate synthase [Ignavibacteria bacterium RIFOXYC12_FULL_35_11
MNERIIIFDTTLRDGEQSPGASLNVYEKLEIARQLAKLKVDVIEAGFPVSSPAQFEAVKRIADESEVIIAGLARAKEIDIKAVYNALRNAKKPRIHTFSSTSDIHILGKFGDSKYGASLEEKRKTILKMSYDSIAYAKTFCNDVEFSAEDAGRTDIGYLCDIIETAIEAGATTVNIPDTTGYTFPSEFGFKIAELKRRVRNIDKVIISVHCHNDLGLAVANSIIAIQNGARQVECTINGIGERAGNASLEEIVMALKVRNDICNYYTDIDITEIYNTSRMVSGFTGIVVQPNKAIVGENAFAHESGIHQDGMLKNKQTYEIMTPESVGVNKTKIILGRHSGRHGLKSRLGELGYHPSEEDMQKVYEAFLELADKKKEVFDDDLRVLMGDEIYKKEELYELQYLHVTAGTDTIPTATIKIRSNEKVIQESCTGDGPVDACFNAIERALEIRPTVESYNVRSVTSGRQALGEAIVRIRNGENSFTGRGTSTDIIEASAKAYLQAINQYLLFTKTNLEFHEDELIIRNV